MKFEYALKAMRDGKKVRRSCWGISRSYIALSNNRFLNEDGNAVSVFDNLLLSNDWEIIEEPQMLWRRPVKYSSGRWLIDPVWCPSKEDFIRNWSSSSCEFEFGEWESMPEPKTVPK